MMVLLMMMMMMMMMILTMVVIKVMMTMMMTIPLPWMNITSPCRFAQTNLMRLRRQCEEHQESKELRQQGQSNRVLVGSLEGASANSGNGGATATTSTSGMALHHGAVAEAAGSGVPLSRQWWLDDDDEWSAGSLPLQLVPRSVDARPALTSGGVSAAVSKSGSGGSSTFRPRILSRQHREGGIVASKSLSSLAGGGSSQTSGGTSGIPSFRIPTIMKRE